MEQYGAGPWGSLHLADLGAEVIKIEDPRSDGDVGRYVPPHAADEDSLFFETFNRNKRSLSLDITTDAGRAVFEDLVRVSDAVYSNLRGDVPAKLRLTYDDLKHLNPQIVCCSLSGYGMTGPRQKDPGYDYLMQGLTGWMSVTGEPDGAPMKSGLSLVDFAGGFVGALALLAGVMGARRTGEGMDCDVSLFDTALAMTNYLATWHLNAGDVPERLGSAHPSLVPFQNVQAADGWFVLACPKEKFWTRLVEAIGRPDLAERWPDFESRRIDREKVIAELTDTLTTQPVDHWLAVLNEAGVPCAPINDIPSALQDPQTEARGMIVETEHERFGRVRSLASPVRVGERPASYRRAPKRHEDADEILADLLGYDTDRIEHLTAAGAWGEV